ncbi:eukaryotic translation initiation factor 3 subunit J [Coprinopsis sp. MPI-PUGE-AT-0042]|nr:eukaryotic translation initiation factor 3 subunit J [Coprinopsis sp. MPI-PUGE-AT-0042]
MSDWDDSGSEKGKATAPQPVKKVPVKKGKWGGEDEDDNAPVRRRAKPAPAPPKKKGTLKAKLAEKEAEKAKRVAEGEDEYDSDDVLDPRAKAKRDRERELNADLSNAAELLGAASLGGTSSSELDSILSAQPRTKEDFQKLATQINELILKRHATKPLYNAMSSVRKVASGLTTLANEKQKEDKDKAGGKKKKAAKPALGGAKTVNKLDTGVYDEALDDFGNDPSDFM